MFDDDNEDIFSNPFSRKNRVMLSINDAVKNQAKTYAAQRGVSLSSLVEDYLSCLTPGNMAENDYIGKYPEATGEVLESIKTWAGKVETAPGGNIPFSDKLRRFAALLDDGRLLIAKSREAIAEVSEAMQILKRQGKPVDNILIVEPDVLRTVYINHEKNAPKNNSRRNRGDGLQEMQKQVLILIEKAALMGASDIHVKVGRHEAEVYMRVDGIMQKQQLIEADIAHDICNAAFNMADASDATYKSGEYQSGIISDIRIPLPEGVQRIRLQFNPLPNGGRYMICRLIYRISRPNSSGIISLGFSEFQVSQLRIISKKPYGINFISGPTSSGKSTTIQHVLKDIIRTRPGINVVTVEDPPEYVIEGASQLPVLNAKDSERNEAFRKAIFIALRFGPDIMMISEIRDPLSANTAFAASMTGHSVWTSVHANDAFSIPNRLRHMDVDRYTLTDHTLISGLVSQRLIRCLNIEKRIPLNEALSAGYIFPEQAENALKILKCALRFKSDLDGIYVAGGVRNAFGQAEGYSGRTVVAEVVIPDRNILSALYEGEKEEAKSIWFRETGNLTMFESALRKMVTGQCSPDDVERTVGPLSGFDENRASAIFSDL